MKKVICLLLCFFTVMSFSSCSERYYEYTNTGVFDTFVQIYSTAESKEDFGRISHKAYDLLMEYHKLYDIYNDYDGINNLKTINDNAGIKPVEVDGKIIALLKFCKEAYYLTDGNVNIAMGSVLKLWHDARVSVEESAYADIPTMDELAFAAEHRNIGDIIIDEENSTVYIRDPLLRIDVGAVAKGYATQRIYEYLISEGVTGGFVSIGGNVKVIGKSNKNRNGSWKIGIQDPENSGVSKVLVNVNYGSLVTSGDYQRYFVSGGVKYHHIIHPDTLYPAEGTRSVTVWVDDSALADVLSTYFFTISHEEALSFISSHPEYNINTYRITSAGKVLYTDGMKEYLD